MAPAARDADARDRTETTRKHREDRFLVFLELANTTPHARLEHFPFQGVRLAELSCRFQPPNFSIHILIIITYTYTYTLYTVYAYIHVYIYIYIYICMYTYMSYIIHIYIYIYIYIDPVSPRRASVAGLARGVARLANNSTIISYTTTT